MSTLEAISRVVVDRSAKEIARAVAELIASGVIPVRERMPTTRRLADALGVSAASISDAWKLLVADGVLETRGRLGTFVVDPTSVAPWRQFRGVVGADLEMDLSTGFPDPELLVDLRPYLARLADEPPYPGYPKTELDPRLAEALAPLLPFPPNEDNTILATHVIGAVAELLPVIGGPATRVIVADPEFAPYLDLLERFRMEPVPVAMDEEGLLYEEVVAAVREGARAVILQPRVHNPSGVVMTRRRLQMIAEECARHDVWVLDGDFYGNLPAVPRMSAAEWAPEHTVYMRAFSKDLHPDIRVAAIVGAPRLIREVHRRRIGGFEVSRINQDLLRHLLLDTARHENAERTREEYRRRQRVFIETMRDRGIEVIGSGGGFNVWVPVRSETDASIYLASKGIGVAPGSAFQVRSSSPHIRVSTAAISGDVARVADEIATAATAGRSKG